MSPNISYFINKFNSTCIASFPLIFVLPFFHIFFYVKDHLKTKYIVKQNSYRICLSIISNDENSYLGLFTIQENFSYLHDSIYIV